MVLLAAAEEKVMPASSMAQSLKVSQAHLAKVMQRLARAGLVKSSRGPAGGFTLTRPKDKINLLEIYEIMEGAQKENRCLLSSEVCPGSACVLGRALHDINLKVLELLADHTLADLLDSPLGQNAKNQAA
jgi:Rrf2 family protein